MTRRPLILATIWALLGMHIGVGTLAQPLLKAGDLQLRLSPTMPFAAATPRDPQLLQGATLIVTLGPERRPVRWRPATIVGSTMRLQATEASLEISLAFRAMSRCLLWELSCVNTGTSALWLELGPALELRPAPGLHVFDGWDDFADPTAPVISERLAGNMPLPCVWNERACVAVGLAPMALVSYLRHEYRPAGEGPAQLAALTRLVIDPGKQENVAFVILATPGEWGKYEAFEAYYESFPAFFRPYPGTDPRLSLGSAQYLTWPAGEWAPEITRRLCSGWDWCYAPFRRTGDIVGRTAFWDYQPARPFDKIRALPREEYLRWRAERFADGARRCDVAMMFYIPSQIWCEETLARERYADALTTDPRATTYFNKPWVTGHDNELRVFPLETSFGKQSYADIAEIAQTLEIAGFAFDTAGEGVRYLGPALPRLPHRAWDEKLGVYCDELVAIAKLMDYVHTLRRNGRPLGVVANPMANGTYASCFHCDSAMLEANPWSGGRTLSDRLRWKMGQKTLVWWEDYDLEDFVDPESVTAEQLTRIYQGLADFTLLQSLRVGYIPPPNFTLGMARLVRWLPAIVACVQAGWQPVPAAHLPAPLWATRYGRGLETRLAIGHETGTDVTGEIVIENARLGEGAFLFSGYDGTATRQQINGGKTIIPVCVPVRTPLLLQAQAVVTPAKAIREARVEAQTGIASASLLLEGSGRGPATIRVRIPLQMRLAQALLNGRPIPASPAGVIKLVVAPKMQLHVRFASTVFALRDEELLDFPFVGKGESLATLCLPWGASETMRHAAFRLQEYFRYWYGRAMDPPQKILLPIVEDKRPQTGPLVRFLLDRRGTPRISRQGRELLLQAPDDNALLELTFTLLRALDTKYWFPERVRATTLNRRTGLAGKIIE